MRVPLRSSGCSCSCSCWGCVMAEEQLAVAARSTNAAPLICPRCDTLILRQGDGRWATHEMRLPKTSVPQDGWPTPEDAVEALGEFWAVDVGEATATVGAAALVLPPRPRVSP